LKAKGGKMLSTYKEKIIKELEGVPGEMMPKLYRIIHLLTTELIPKTKEKKDRGSLKGIWKGSQIDESLFLEAKKSLFSYEYK
jgi:hypothetical protein